MITTSIVNRSSFVEIERKEKLSKQLMKLEEKECEILDAHNYELDEVYEEVLTGWFHVESVDYNTIVLSYMDADLNEERNLKLISDPKCCRHIKVADQYLGQIGFRDNNWYFIFVDCIAN